MTVNARRSRRGFPAAAEAEPQADPVSDTATDAEPGSEAGSGSGRQAGSSSGRVVAFPEPAIAPAPLLPPQFTPAPPAAVEPSAPREEPAVLHPSDRRWSEPARPMFASASSMPELAIGEIEQTLFDCPSCRRPLALGARRCPGCGTRLIRSVMLRKAALFIAIGVAIGVVGGLGGGIAIGTRLAGPAAAGAIVATTSQAPDGSRGTGAGTTASQAPSATPSAEPVSTPSPAGGSMPSVVRGALVQALAVDDRLGAAEADLRAALATKTFDASAVAATMRTISAESVFAESLAPAISAWSDGADLGAALAAFYGTVHDTAVTALDNSVQNAAGYKAAARSMVTLLAGRSALDDAIRSAAEAAGVSLPVPSTAP